jgi:hypothetical protein
MLIICQKNTSALVGGETFRVLIYPVMLRDLKRELACLSGAGETDTRR